MLPLIFPIRPLKHALSGILSSVLLLYPGISMALEPSRENLFQMGSLAARDGQYEQAADFFRKAIEIDPKFVPAYNSLGLLYETDQLQDIKQAVRYFRMAVDLKPDFVEGLNNLGRAYYTQGDFIRAAKMLQRSLDLRPEQPEIEITLGWVYLLGQSRAGEAIEHFERGLTKTDNAMAYYGVGLANLIKGEKFRALDSITQLRRRQREDLAEKLERMIKENVRLNSVVGSPLMTGTADQVSSLEGQLKAMGRSKADVDNNGIQVRLRGPLN
jgi:tetratricopeptide (TPR) repeat protein